MDAYEEQFIKEVKATDTKIAISGTVISSDEATIVIDDGTGQMPIFMSEVQAPNAEYVRVFGRVIPYDAGLQVQADVIQDLSKIDRQAHKKVKEKLYNDK